MIFADNTRAVPDADVVSCQLDTGMVLLNLRTKTYYALDPVGVAIWSSLEAGADIGATCSAVRSEFAVEPMPCRRDTEELLMQMERAGVVAIERSTTSAS